MNYVQKIAGVIGVTLLVIMSACHSGASNSSPLVLREGSMPAIAIGVDSIASHWNVQLRSDSSGEQLLVCVQPDGRFRCVELEGGNRVRQGTEYFPNGRPIILKNQDSNLSGHVVVYHENGGIELEGWMIKGEKVGTWRTYDPSGMLIRADTITPPDVEHPGNPIR